MLCRWVCIAIASFLGLGEVAAACNRPLCPRLLPAHPVACIFAHGTRLTYLVAAQPSHISAACAHAPMQQCTVTANPLTCSNLEGAALSCGRVIAPSPAQLVTFEVLVSFGVGAAGGISPAVKVLGLCCGLCLGINLCSSSSSTSTSSGRCSSSGKFGEKEERCRQLKVLPTSLLSTAAQTRPFDGREGSLSRGLHTCTPACTSEDCH
jgi:hypothetical protein